MAKIYVCQSGCKYEGGSAFYASTSFIKAWKRLREARIQVARCPLSGTMRLLNNTHWENDMEYFSITAFSDGD